MVSTPNPPPPSPEVTAYLHAHHSTVYDLALWVRAAVLTAEPDLDERVYAGWGGLGYRHPEGGYVCGIFPAAEHVRLVFEHGRQLDDRDGILQGDGRQTRHVTIRAPNQALRRSIRHLVREAVSERLLRVGRW